MAVGTVIHLPKWDMTEQPEASLTVMPGQQQSVGEQTGILGHRTYVNTKMGFQRGSWAVREGVL